MEASMEARTKGPSGGGRRRVMFFVFEESEFIEEIQASHAPDTLQVDVAPVLGVIETIFQRSHLNNDAVNVTQEKMGSVTAVPDGKVLESLAVIIQKVCFEVTNQFSCKCSGDIHRTTMAILNILRRYSWDAKVVIALAAFAAAYGEMWLVMLLGMADHPLAKSIALLKQTPDISEIDGVLKPQFTILNDLIGVVMDVMKSLIEFRLICSKGISSNNDAMASQIATATYWSIRSIIACGAHISTGTVGATHGLKSSSEAWDLSSLVHKLTSIHDQLLQLLSLLSEISGNKNGGKRVSVYELTVSGN